MSFYKKILITLLTVITTLGIASGVSFAFTGPSVGQTPGTGGGALQVDGQGNLVVVSPAVVSDGNSLVFQPTGGSVGIGTTEPGSLLDVSGIITGNSFSGVGTNLTSIDPQNFISGSVFNSGNYAIEGALSVGTSTVTGLPVNGLFVDGNVGIGTTGPSEKFHVNSGGDNIIALFESTDSAGGIDLKDGSTGESGGTSNVSLRAIANDMQLVAGGSEVVRIGSNGNVGIGTTAPSEKLEVKGGNISIEHTGGYQVLFLGQFSSGNGIQGQLNNNLTLQTLGNNNNEGITFQDTSGTELVRIVGDGGSLNGNVGIGTTNPQEALHVNSSSATHIRTTSDGTGSGGTDGTQFGLSSNDDALIWNYENTDFRLATNAIERLRVDSDGNVGIGTTDPDGKLAVELDSSGDGLMLGGRNLDVDFHLGDTNNWGEYGFYWRYKGTGSSNDNDLELWANNQTGTDQQVYNIKQNGNIEFFQEVSIPAPSEDPHAATKSYVDSVVGEGGPAEDLYVNETGDTMTGNLTFSGSANEYIGIVPETDVNLRLGTGAGTEPRIYLKGTANGQADAGDIYMAAGGVSNQLILNANGNVGIGTTDPSEQLHVSGGTGSVNLFLEADTNNNGESNVPSLVFNQDGNLIEWTVGSDADNDFKIEQTIGSGYAINVTGNKITNLGTPTGSSDAATKSYVDSASGGGISTPDGTTGETLYNNAGTWTATTNLFHNGTNVGIGTDSPDTLLSLANNSWISAKNSAGTGYVNMMKVNSSDEIEIGGTLNLGTIELAEDSGAVTLVNMPVSATPAQGTQQSYSFSLDSNTLMTVYGEADGSGGTQNTKIDIPTSIHAQIMYDRDNNTYYSNPSSLSNLNTLTVNGNWTLSGAAQANVDLNGNNLVGVNKITVATIDPLYQIDGEKYATYVSDTVGGVKSEIFGKVELRREFGLRTAYSHTIDFDQVKEGSDLWVFWKTINLGDDMSDMIVNLTAEGANADTWYELLPEENQLVISSNRDVKVSYHLTAPRHDSDEWPTETDTDETPSFILENGEWIK